MIFVIASNNEKKIREIDEQLALPETGTDLSLCQRLASERSILQKALETRVYSVNMYIA